MPFKERQLGQPSIANDGWEAVTPWGPALPNQRSICVWENLKDLIEPRDFEDRAHGFLQSRQHEFASVAFHLLHRLNQGRESRAVDVAYL